MKGGSSQKRGFVLVLVLGAIAVMAALVVSLNLRCRAAAQTSSTWSHSQQALNNAYSGLAAAMVQWSDPNTVVTEPWTLKLDQGQCDIEILPESGRLSVNTLLNRQGQPIEERIHQWARLIDVLNREPGHPTFSYRIIAALVDWTDKNDKVTNLAIIRSEPIGAEQYHIGSMSRSCPNRPVNNISELKWLSGMNPALFKRLKNEISCSSNPKVDLNYASKTVLQALSSHIDPVLAQIILQGRSVSPYKSMEEISQCPGMTTEAFKDLSRWGGIKLESPQALIKSHGIFNGVKRHLIAQVQRNSTTRSVDVLSIKEI